MDILVDTHAIIWFITDHDRLPQPSKVLIASQDNVCYASLASFWEMGIKYSLGRLELKSSLDRIFTLIEESGFTLLPVLPEHILKITDLPFHHKDPFDRLLIAQAQKEDFTILTKDNEFNFYEVKTIWLK